MSDLPDARTRAQRRVAQHEAWRRAIGEASMETMRIQEVLATVTYLRVAKHGYEKPEIILPDFNELHSGRNATPLDLLKAQIIIAKQRGEIDVLKKSVPPALWDEANE